MGYCFPVWVCVSGSIVQRDGGKDQSEDNVSGLTGASDIILCPALNNSSLKLIDSMELIPLATKVEQESERLTQTGRLHLPQIDFCKSTVSNIPSQNALIESIL